MRRQAATSGAIAASPAGREDAGMATSDPVQIQLDALRGAVGDRFSNEVLGAAARAWADMHNPLRLNFFATALRILSEHSLERLAPTADLVRCGWYAAQRDNGEPTRPQRVKYVIQGGLDDAFVGEALGIDIAPLQKRLTQTVKRLSAQVHAREHTVVRDPVEQARAATEMLSSLADLFRTADQARRSIVTPIQEGLDAAAVDALLAETIQAVDELATHHSIEEVYVGELVVQALTSEAITYRAAGTLVVGLQWGSNSDVRKGDGAELDQSFPFTCEIVLPIDEPWNLELAETNYSVDTDSWTDMMAPDDEPQVKAV